MEEDLRSLVQYSQKKIIITFINKKSLLIKELAQSKEIDIGTWCKSSTADLKIESKEETWGKEIDVQFIWEAVSNLTETTLRFPLQESEVLSVAENWKGEKWKKKNGGGGENGWKGQSQWCEGSSLRSRRGLGGRACAVAAEEAASSGDLKRTLPLWLNR